MAAGLLFDQEDQEKYPALPDAGFAAGRGLHSLISGMPRLPGACPPTIPAAPPRAGPPGPEKGFRAQTCPGRVINFPFA